jgi:hypothetical protein
MLVIRDPEQANSIADPQLRALVQKTIANLSEDYPYDPDELGYFVIVQPGDSLGDINEQIGFDILANRWDGISFGQPGFTPAFELMEEHAGFFEMLFVIDDSGYGIQVFIHKHAGIPGKVARQQGGSPILEAKPA